MDCNKKQQLFLELSLQANGRLYKQDINTRQLLEMLTTAHNLLTTVASVTLVVKTHKKRNLSIL